MIKSMISENSWSNYINTYIESEEQRAIYQKAGLTEMKVLGRNCLVKSINLDYVSPEVGLSNRDLMRKGKAPFDFDINERIVLHHMKQDYNGPTAELCMFSEHSGAAEPVLHSKTRGSWRDESSLKHKHDKTRRKYWKERLKQLEETDAK